MRFGIIHMTIYYFFKKNFQIIIISEFLNLDLLKTKFNIKIALIIM